MPERQNYKLNAEHLGRNKLLSTSASATPSPSPSTSSVPVLPTSVVPASGAEADPLQCPHCGKRFSRKHDTQRHIEIHSKPGKAPGKRQKPKNHICDAPRCVHTAYSANMLTQHKEAVHLGITWKCRFCDKRANRIDGAQEHERFMHPDDVEKDKSGKPIKLDAQGRVMDV
ncbi:Hypothetical protein D9617_37g012630 [Elsinoe fawcettii]|nr:Hypothetical protein D9617_37g012630 [Elsinoe fawcettii]